MRFPYTMFTLQTSFKSLLFKGGGGGGKTVTDVTVIFKIFCLTTSKNSASLQYLYSFVAATLLPLLSLQHFIQYSLLVSVYFTRETCCGVVSIQGGSSILFQRTWCEGINSQVSSLRPTKESTSKALS